MRVDIDAETGVAAACGAWAQLEKAAVQLHGVIVLDRTAVFEAADAIEIGRRRAPSGGGIRWRLREAGIVAGQKPVEHALGVCQGPSLGQSEFDHEAILEGPEEPLNPTLIWYEIVGCTLLMIGCGQLAAVLW